MNATTELELIEPAELSAPYPEAAPATAQLVQIAIQQGASIEVIERVWALQIAAEKHDAEKKYNDAFAAFKAHAIRVIKNKEVAAGPLSGKKYAELFAVVNAVTPALSEHGLSASWKLTKDEREWIEVTCVLKHSAGHCESVSMGGPPDSGGAKNPIQSRASTVSYLERYTLKAILGISEQSDDDDGGHSEGQGNFEAVNRTLVMKVRSAIQEHIAKDRPMGVAEEWDAARELGEDFQGGVWSGLTSPERDYIRQVNNNRQTAKA